MSNLKALQTNRGTVYVAANKYDYIENIIDSISLCSDIKKVVLFGSAASGTSTDSSDIDLSLFGSMRLSQYYRSKDYRRFLNSVYSYNNHLDYQDYDILYYQSGKEYDDNILEDINRGVVLYEKE
ncbi:MAG: nucleotidyltransferase domain-containing protein [Lachnospiraceae bacterium]|nr:nucleotidyltransferase domain-containing protein [Lachnospiraceae bacterium]